MTRPRWAPKKQAAGRPATPLLIAALPGKTRASAFLRRSNEIIVQDMAVGKRQVRDEMPARIRHHTAPDLSAGSVRRSGQGLRVQRHLNAGASGERLSGYQSPAAEQAVADDVRQTGWGHGS